MSSDQGSVTGSSTPECITDIDSGSSWLDRVEEPPLSLKPGVEWSELVVELKKDKFMSTSSLNVPIGEEDFPGVDQLLLDAEALHIAMPPWFRGPRYMLASQLILCILKFLEAPSGPPRVTQIDGNIIKSLTVIGDKIHVIQLDDPHPKDLLETGLIAACLLEAPVIVTSATMWICLDFIDGTVYWEGMVQAWFANCWGTRAVPDERERLSQNLYKLNFFLNNYGQRTIWKTQ